jgi:hypothetical protein
MKDAAKYRRALTLPVPSVCCREAFLELKLGLWDGSPGRFRCLWANAPMVGQVQQRPRATPQHDVERPCPTPATALRSRARCANQPRAPREFSLGYSA